MALVSRNIHGDTLERTYLTPAAEFCLSGITLEKGQSIIIPATLLQYRLEGELSLFKAFEIKNGLVKNAKQFLARPSKRNLIMKIPNQKKILQTQPCLVQCVNCSSFSFFENEKGHNSPQAIGKCQQISWNGNRGQWPMIYHPCKYYKKVNVVDS